jgi:hypothetical protein
VSAPSRHRGIWLLVAIAMIAALPMLFQDSYWRTNLIVCALNVMLAIGLDFILGYAGQLNLGHSAFYGIGAYASTLLIMKLGLPFWIAFLLAMALVRHSRGGAVGFCSAPARPLPCHRVARLCRHRASGAAQLDQPHPGTARHLCDQAAA